MLKYWGEGSRGLGAIIVPHLRQHRTAPAHYTFIQLFRHDDTVGTPSKIVYS